MKSTRLALAGLLLAVVPPAAAQSNDPPIGHGFPDGKTIDIAGIYFGMNGAKARPVLNAHYANQKGKSWSQYGMERMPFTNETFVRMAWNNYRAGNINFDNLRVLFSTPASGNQAVFISREAQYLDDARPNRAATIAAIKEKFGEPSDTVRDRMEFYYAGGRRLTKASGEPFAACGSGGHDISRAATAAGSFNDLRKAFQAMHRTPGACDVYVNIELTSSSDVIGGQIVRNENVIGRLIVWAFDVSRFLATTNTDAKFIETMRNKARQSIPSGKGAPKL
jgi:hypothetical protein